MDGKTTAVVTFYKEETRPTSGEAATAA